MGLESGRMLGICSGHETEDGCVRLLPASPLCARVVVPAQHSDVQQVETEAAEEGAEPGHGVLELDLHSQVVELLVAQFLGVVKENLQIHLLFF